MTKDQLIRKLTSRKFWVAVTGFVTLIMTARGFDSGSIEQVVAIIMAGAAVLAYIIAEGLVDSAGAGSPIFITNNTEVPKEIDIK